MLTIRQEQQEAFRQVALKNFEDRMIVHLRKFFPGPLGKRGEVKTRETIQYGVERAGTYGIIAERDVCQYIDLMMAFGNDFDRDPRLPWAVRTLRDPSIAHPTTRISRLYEQVTSSTRSL